MHLMYTLDAEGKRVYTLKKATGEGAPTESAHPARSKHRLTCKKRFGILLTQRPAKQL